ncbi:MAG: hypothetical protein H7062_10045 [Candidatus Saccharimonas sp.]|nr:hypothetical protein [Planctomycetaceae bacterium]
MTTLTPEQRQLVEQAGGAPVRLEDPETREEYVLLKLTVYEHLLKPGEVALVDPSDYEDGEFHPRDAYAAIDQAFAEGWDDPRMAEYDEYEKHRP